MLFSQTRPRLALVATATLCASLALSIALAPAAFADDTTAQGTQHTFYSSKTPYAAQGTAADYQQVPTGFTQIYTESLARHGARALSSFKYDSLTQQLWAQAQSENALTPLGATLGPETAALTAANNTLGYGNLSGLGATQHQQIGARAVERMPDFFAQIIASDDIIELESSGEPRATESGENFAVGLLAANPALADKLPTTMPASPETLHFHDQEFNQDYMDYEESDLVADSVAAIWDQPQSKEVSRHVLERLYTTDFVDRLAAGDYHFEDPKGKTTIDNEVDAAMMLYNLYIIAPDLVEEGDWNFDQYLEPEDAEWFAYLLDTEDFYSKGPAFVGNDITYKMATPLLQEFFDGIDARLAGSNVAATFRFAHAETIVPFAALIQLPGSEQPVTAATPYTYATNAWRGESVTPMAANVQWDVYSNSAGQTIMRMLYNEKEIAFNSSCQPLEAGSHYYDVTEVKRCLLGIAVPETSTPAVSTDPVANTAASTQLAETGAQLGTMPALIALLLLAGIALRVVHRKRNAHADAA
ncbi:histidine-type phosphatase [Cryobacterium lactosi]|uniref:Multiple inositol polyphosphate phosphatase 1 n=1 Tax=Cryobacterium lactosi TaxID=1259202 RepID=A0A4R9BGW1_9MICO|nr:histidine-type phosphatase [Cryobacterium lactosi]